MSAPVPAVENADPRMPVTIVLSVIIQVLLIAFWGAFATLLLRFAIGDILDGDGGFFSLGVGGVIFVMLLGLAAVAVGLVNVMRLVGLYREVRPGTLGTAFQIAVVGIMALLGLVMITSGVGMMYVIIPLMIVNAILLRLAPSRRWFDEVHPGAEPTRWAMLLIVFTALAAGVWIVSAAVLALVLPVTEEISGSSTASMVPGAWLTPVLVLLGIAANVVVLIAIARKWRLPREIALAGSMLAGLGLVLLWPGVWWLAVLAALPSVLLWLPASTRAFRARSSYREVSTPDLQSRVDLGRED